MDDVGAVMSGVSDMLVDMAPGVLRNLLKVVKAKLWPRIKN